MTLVVTWLEITFRGASIFLFPAMALWAWRAGGAARLWRVTGLGIGLILLFAAFAASRTGGNVLAPIYGYRYTASLALGLYGLTLGLRVVSAALAIQVLAGRWLTRLGLYAVGVLCAGVAWIAGVLAAVRILVISGP